MTLKREGQRKRTASTVCSKTNGREHGWEQWMLPGEGMNQECTNSMVT